MTFFDRENHRRYPRTFVDCLVHLSPLDASSENAGPSSRDCIVQDISASGMRIWADRSYSINDKALLSFECERVGVRHATSCVVTVVWADFAPTEDRWQLGVKFGDDSDSRHLAEVLARGCAWCEKLTPEIAAEDDRGERMV